MRGELVLTDEGLFNYWQQEWVICTDRIHHLETTLAGMTARARTIPRSRAPTPRPSPPTRNVWRQRGHARV
ncbi:hypothetical protein [Microbacterium sp. NIBRBAC000506063]|uniref:hypothetical protein n=1 Tax=Microbacterium sp. NIBRBAC000506063 TaxID=2734618 RepID=UPI001BB49F18|nr:hypothetical protein [Microbacterium sp. NIBRBAC000506063]QTV80366.1 hypothetical protein KAE78_05315 [Microbacterium sp. NIBRBAC000506063]